MQNIKKIISLSFAIPLFSSMLNATAHQEPIDNRKQDHNIMSIEELKNHCLQMRGNDQMKPFSIKVECSGKYTYWTEEQNSTQLPVTSNMSVQTSTKCGRHSTPESIFESNLEGQNISCPTLIEKEVSTSDEVNIPVTINTCEELDTMALETMCRETVTKYCQDNTVNLNQEDNNQNGYQQQVQQNETEGMCTLKTKQTVDTCSKY